MLNESLESFCTLSWDNSDVLPYRTGQFFKIVLCLSTWKVFHAFYSRKIQITTLQVYSHIYFLFLVPVNTRIYLTSMPFPLQKKKKKELAFWLILPSSKGKKISHCLFLSKIIQIVCFNEEINCHFLQDLGCCLLLMRCHSWLHAYRILIWSYFSSYLFFFWGASLVFTSIQEDWKGLAHDKNFSALGNCAATSTIPPKITSVIRLWEIQS